jgi:hypothetical protein
MAQSNVRALAAVLALALLSAAGAPAAAQSGDTKAGEQQKPPAASDAAKDQARQIDEYAEAQRLLAGAAGNPECVWLGRRAVNLLWRDDLDTAFRHLDLYDRFGCPAGHIQLTFRCVVRQGNIDPKAPDSLNARVHACWINPNLPPTPPATTGSTSQNGTTAQAKR